MHPFYQRMQRVFKRAGSNRHKFCRKYGYNYQTLGGYWNTDKLPPGNVLEDIAREFHVSLDKLVLGRVSVSIGEESPTLARITVQLKQMSETDLLRLEGAMSMLWFLRPPGAAGSGQATPGVDEADSWADLEELTDEEDAESPATD